MTLTAWLEEGERKQCIDGEYEIVLAAQKKRKQFEMWGWATILDKEGLTG